MEMKEKKSRARERGKKETKPKKNLWKQRNKYGLITGTQATVSGIKTLFSTGQLPKCGTNKSRKRQVNERHPKKEVKKVKATNSQSCC